MSLLAGGRSFPPPNMASLNGPKPGSKALNKSSTKKASPSKKKLDLASKTSSSTKEEVFDKKEEVLSGIEVLTRGGEEWIEQVQKKTTRRRIVIRDDDEKKVPASKKKPSAKEEEDGTFVDQDLGCELPTFDINEEVDQSSTWRFRPMYKEKLTGADMVWWVGFDVDTEELLMAHGQVGGKIQLNRTKVELNQSGRSMEEQSLLEATQRRLEKYRQGYRCLGEEPPDIDEPMLAKVWEPEKTRLSYPVGVQPKLDGVRCLARLTKAGTVMMRSRNSVTWQATSQSFFENEIAAFLSFLPPNAELDGEMWGPSLHFQDIVSIIKDPKVMAKRIDEISYNVFTYTDLNLPAEERNSILKKAMAKYRATAKELGVTYNPNRLTQVRMYTATCKEDIYELHKKFLKQGYEGSMIYKFCNGDEKNLKASVYKPKRSNNVLKYKATLEGADMLEEEGKIIDVYAGKGTQEGAIMFKVIDPRGNEVRVGLMGSIEKRRAMMKNKDAYLGQELTYKYQNLTKAGIPRFPIGKAIRDYE